jgi:leader peptidase (prepilin peptidase) / N-methyltransferase
VPSALTLAGAVVGLLLGPWLAVTSVRLAERDPAARPSRARVVATSLLAAVVVAAGPALAGDRPAAVALAWFGAAALVLGDVDLRRHRLPDRVTWPALIGCGVALSADAVVTGEPGAVLRAGVAAVVAAGAGVAARVVSPAALGRGDVKLLALLGMVLGWAGWGVLLGGVFAGLLVGALGSVLLIAAGRAGWRTRVPLGPPLLAGACVALWLAGPLPLT